MPSNESNVVSEKTVWSIAVALLISSSAVLIGAVVFATVVKGFNPAKLDFNKPIPLLSSVCLGVAAMNLVVSALLPRFLARKNLGRLASSKSEEQTRDAIVQGWLQATVVRFALLESIVVLMSVMFVFEGQVLLLAVAMATWLLMLYRLPTQAQFVDFVAEQKEALRNEGL